MCNFLFYMDVSGSICGSAHWTLFRDVERAQSFSVSKNRLLIARPPRHNCHRADQQLGQLGPHRADLAPRVINYRMAVVLAGVVGTLGFP